MRILMISEFYPPLIGGTERHVQTLSRELVRRGHHVAVATMRSGSSPAFENDQGVYVYRLEGWSQTLLAPFYQNQVRPFHPPVPDPGIQSALRLIIQQEHPEIVHARRWMLYSFVGIKKWSKAKLVVTLHDYSLVCPTAANMYEGQICSGPEYRKCIRCSLDQYGPTKAPLIASGLKMSSHLHQQVDKFIAVSSAVLEASVNGSKYPLRDIEVVPTFIPDNSAEEGRQIPRPAYLPSEDNYLLFVGRQDMHKGLDVLLDAYDESLSRLAPLVLMLAGNETLSRSLPKSVTVVRNVPHAEVMAGWLHCMAGVVPSTWPEPFGQVAVEAMLCGKPVVVSAIGGLRDVIVPEESGLLFEAGNPHSLREALRKVLLMDPEKRVCMGEAASKRAHLFTVGTVANRIEQIYEEVLAAS